MKKSILKELAIHTIQGGRIQTVIAEYALTKLSKSDIKIYLFYLKQEINKSTVLVTSAQELNSMVKQKLMQLYMGKDIKFNTEEKIVGGITIQNGDDFTDVSITGTIDKICNKLKNSL